MIKEYIKDTTPTGEYGRYFLSLEAPGDTEEPVVKRNTKVIDVKPNNRSKKDFTDGAEEPEEIPEETPEEETGDADTDTTDYTGDEPAPQEEQPVEDQPTEDPNTVEVIDNGTTIEDDVAATNAEIDANNNIDFTTDDVEMNTDVDTPDEAPEEGDPNEPDTGEGEDFTGDGEPTEDVPQEGEVHADAAQEERKGPGLEYDSTRKYILFKNYISLSNAIDNYITKLENKINDDPNNNTIIKKTTEKLREIKELCYEYMTMKFEASSYIQSLLFFQNLVTMIQMCFNLLEKMKKNNKINKK